VESTTSIRIPNRFESILANATLDYPPLLIPVEDDLRSLDHLRRLADMQGGGLLSFVLGESGVGKTTAVYAAATFMADRVAPVVLIPHDVPLRGVDDWIGANLPAEDGRAQFVLLDGREITDDDVGLRQLMSALNQRLRRRSDVVLIWPTTDADWYAELRDTAEKVGGDSFAPTDADITIEGPPKDTWTAALERLLIQLDRSLDDIALDEATIAAMADNASTIGRFLRNVGAAIVERVDAVQLSRTLPSVLFIVTSTSEVVGEANRLRRAQSFLLGARELLGYSPRSRAGKWWLDRLHDPSHHLAYIISLFTARLGTMTPSSVVYACAEFGDDVLQDLVRAEGIARSSGNADRTFKNTDAFQLLSREPLSELTSTRKGRTAETTKRAYASVQAQSAKKHKTINQAITALAGRNIPDLDAGLATFEVNQGGQSLYTDVIIPWGSEDLYVEFHHLSEAHCKAASISAYIMEKLQYYAIQYNLVPR
jgi:hypothetical protein